MLNNELDGRKAGNKISMRQYSCLQVLTGFTGEQRCAVLKLENESKCVLCMIKSVDSEGKEKYWWLI